MFIVSELSNMGTCQTTESSFYDFYARTMSHAVSEHFACDVRAASFDDLCHLAQKNTEKCA